MYLRFIDHNVTYNVFVNTEITRTRRVEPPANYTFQINSYSTLSEIGMKKCESGNFAVDGYNWFEMLRFEFKLD